MRFFILFVPLLLISCNFLFAQQTVGFSEPDDIQPLLDYRLLDWQYSNFFLGFSASGSGNDQKSGIFRQVQKSGNFIIAPGYNLYRESEKQILQFNIRTNLSYGTRVFSEDLNMGNGKEERKRNTLRTDLDIVSSIREYVADNSFIYGQGNFRLLYQSRKREARQGGILNTEIHLYDRNVHVRPKLGFGIGRIRNVNPVIRALRLRERVNEVNSTLRFDNQDVQNVAKQFAKYDGYRQTYDRPEKYFWNDLNSATNSQLEELNAFDVLYLTDVFDEAIGRRLEGWEVIAGAELDYRNNLRREDDQLVNTNPVSRNLLIRKEVGPFINGRWYKNTSLNQQWGITADASLGFVLDDGNNDMLDTQRIAELNLAINWLWNITDRILVESSLGERYTRTKQKPDGSFGSTTEFSQWVNQLSLDTNLSYFLENRMQFNVFANPVLEHRGDSESAVKLNNRFIRWEIGAGLSYYFSRNLN